MSGPERLIFAELAMSGVYHSVINASMVEILKLRYPHYDTCFYASQSHLKALGELLNTETSLKRLPAFPSPSLKTLLLRDFLGMFYAFFILCSSKKRDLVFFTYVLPCTHWVIFLLNKFLKRRVCIMLHGQVEAYVANSPLHGTKIYFGLEKFIYKHDFQTTYFILGDVIHNQIQHIFAGSTKIVTINHPYKFDPLTTTAPDLSFPLRIAQVGVGNSSKGTDLIFDLAFRLKDLIELGQVKFSIIGKLDPSLCSLDNGLVDYFKDFVPSSEYSRLLSKLHFTLLLRNKDQGNGVASGSFLDTLTHCKPYLSLDNAYVCHYHNFEPSSGIICKDIDHLEVAIRSIIEDLNLDQYNQRCHSVFRLRPYFEIAQIANHLTNISL